MQIRLADFVHFHRVRHPLQGFVHDVVCVNPGTENLRCHFRHCPVLFRPFGGGGHRGGRPDADQVVRFQLRAEAADKERDIGALTAAIRMEFVEHQELKPLAVLYDRAIGRTHEDEFQHHVVREQDVRRIRAEHLTLGLGFLPRVARHGERRRVPGVRQELLNFFLLRIRERVHRVEDDRPGARFRIGRFFFKDPIDDRNKEGKRLTGAGAGRHDVRLFLSRELDCLGLMEIKPERLSVFISENRAALRMQHVMVTELLNGSVRLVAGVDLNQRLRPVGL